MKNTVKLFLFLSLFVCFCFFASLPVFGAELPEGFSELTDSLPEEVKEYLPDGIFSEDGEEVGEALSEMTDSKNIFAAVSDMLTDELTSSVVLFAKICGLLLISAVFGALGRSLSSDSLSGAVKFCATTAIFASIIHMQKEHIEAVGLFFDRLTALMTAMVPITGTVWAMGGNVSTASVGTSALYVFISACEGICAKSVVPVCCIFTALALCNTLSPEMGLRGLSGAMRKIYTFGLGMIMTVLIASLSAQTTLSAAADSTAARAARLVSANVIPVVGGSVGDTLRTVATGVQYLKSVVGIWGIVFIALLLLPTLLSLILTRLAFLLSSGVADMLGCESEGRLLSELGGVYAIMVAVVSMSSVMFIFALTIFSKTVVAIL
ncbi:MAG: hypothetical protein IJ011_03750 [Clostridia bacterium]|nr:hypothetical protein [Clostridia bacterium]